MDAPQVTATAVMSTLELEDLGSMQTIRNGSAQAQPISADRDMFRPSDYTGMLMHAARMRQATYGRGHGLDMGVGSGVLLATLGKLGVSQLWGVDIDPQAIEATRLLLQGLGFIGRASLRQGSLWEPVGEMQFNIVVANLPHFAATEPSDPDHSEYWSMGGVDGRSLLDPFLIGLGAHLTEDGVALITHNSFVGQDRTESLLAEQGLVAQVVLSTTVVLPQAKMILLQPQVRARYTGAGICRLGRYEFVDVQILEIRRG